jgi:L-amino acid N-acyltransferase YncA
VTAIVRLLDAGYRHELTFHYKLSSGPAAIPASVPYSGAMGDTRPQPTIEPLRPADWPAVEAIYLEGIATGLATFEQRAPSWPAWDGAHRGDCRLVARDSDGTVLGWAALSPYSARAVYSGVAELSVYVAEAARGRGVGSALLTALIAESEEAGIWTLQAGVFPENEASLRLHARFGFRRVGVRERIGRDVTGRWRDVVLLERRSAKVGVD